jgi:hypothetical protein
MTAIQLEAHDLAYLTQAVPDLRFDDDERQAALLESGSRDFNAVPGSGKTSLLAAKLILLAKKWPHAHKGLCILSHTNVAREEITRRLARSDEGSALLGYPHFLGTIHGFVNQYLAMAALRLNGVKVDVIDDAAFAKRALALVGSGRYRTLRAWLDRQPNADALVSKLYFKGPALDVFSEGGTLPSLESPSGKQIAGLKRTLAAEGIFRHRDMFAYAEVALATSPQLLDVVHRRFPMVFIDEMQDTSWEQEDILNRLFDGRSIVQRFGDVDQKIIADDESSGKPTFPRENHGTISTSKRFGKRIADAVASVRVSRLPVTGQADDTCSPLLMLYKTADIGRVLYRFGEHVIDRFDQATLTGNDVRAMCARRDGQSNVDAGRHLVDYWPAFERSRQAPEEDRLQSLLQRRIGTGHRTTLVQRVADVRRCVLLALQAAKAPVAEGLFDGRALLRTAKEQTGDARQLEKLIRELTLSDVACASPADRSLLAARLYADLAPLLPKGMTPEEFAALDLFNSPVPAQQTPSHSDNPTVCTVKHVDRELGYGLDTIAGMKGETHLASLVLESYGSRSRRFDLELALPFIAGVNEKFDKLKPTQLAQMRNLYVAMSRPKHFLCLAANASRVDDRTIEALRAKGWEIDNEV